MDYRKQNITSKADWQFKDSFDKERYKKKF